MARRRPRVTTTTGRPIEPAGLNRQYAALCRRAGIEPGPLHNLRHTAATLLRQHGGADLLDLSRMLGHSSVRITGDMYGHVVTDVQ